MSRFLSSCGSERKLPGLKLWWLALTLSLNLTGWVVGVERLVPDMYPTILNAVNAAADGDVIIIKPGLYTGGGNLDVSLANKSLTIRCTDPENPAVVAATIIDCKGTAADPHRAFKCRPEEEKPLILSGLTIINGYGPVETVEEFDREPSPASAGGAIHATGYGLTLSRCVFSGNRAALGGACFSQSGRPVVTHCTFLDNMAERRGGALYVQEGDEIPVSGCTFTRNQAGEGAGGAIFASECHPRLQDCVLTENLAVSGGAAFCRAGNSLFKKCRFIANRALDKGGATSFRDSALGQFIASELRANRADGGQGGAVCYEGSVGGFWSCLLAGNIAGREGGAAYSVDGDLTVSVSTLAHNTAGTAGGAVWVSGEAAMAVIPNSSVFHGNTAQAGAQITLSGGLSVVFRSCAVQGGLSGIQSANTGGLTWDGEGNLDADPLFVDADGPDDNPWAALDNNYHLVAGSPLIDAGRDQASLGPIDADLDDYARFADDPAVPDSGVGQPPLADIGAYERSSLPIIMMSGFYGYLAVREGTTAEVQVKLSAPPGGDLIVSTSWLNGDGDLAVQAGASLTFTPANFDQWQKVTFSAAEDADSTDGSAVFQLKGPGPVAVELIVREVDNDTPRVETDVPAVPVPEGGTATFKVRLSKAPTVQQVAVQVTRPAGDANITVQAGSNLIFTAANYSVWQTVTLAAADDADALNGEATIRCGAGGYQATEVTATELDDDAFTIIVEPPNVAVVEGKTNTFRVKLSAPPPPGVEVTVAPVSGDADISIQSGSSLAFTAANYSVFQTVMLAAAEDADAAHGEATIRCAWGPISTNIIATEVDNDVQAILANVTLVTVPENGTAEFLVRLKAQPPGGVTVTVERVDGDIDLAVMTGGTLHFTPANWHIDQAVTLSAARDIDAEDGEALIRCSAAGLSPRELPARESDNWSDTGLPEVRILSPTAGPVWSTDSAAVSLSGTASDEGGVVGLDWASSRGFAGPCAGTATWTASAIPLEMGENVITVAGRDALGHTGTDVLTVTRVPPDTTSPVVTILGPTDSDYYNTAGQTLVLEGTAADNLGAVEATWVNNRGGGGMCSGVNNWRTGSIALKSGENVITVTARDAAGNVGADTLTVTFNPPDLVNPSIEITVPTNQSAYTTVKTRLDIAGSALDNVGITAVTWVSDRGGEGACIGATAWSASGVVLKTGVNTITVRALDAAGNIGTDSLVVTCAPEDKLAPAVVIAHPAEETIQTLGASIDLSGTAGDDVEVTHVVWSNNRGGAGQCEGLAEWAVRGIALEPGVNVITITARDGAGHSGFDAVVVTRDMPDVTPPTVTILQPAGAVLVSTETIVVRGAAADARGVTLVRWNNDRGGEGTATGTSEWIVERIPLAPGRNLIAIRAQDAVGNTGIATLEVIRASPDIAPPTVAILEPSGETLRTSNQRISLRGTASDDAGLAEVVWSSSRGGQGVCTGLETWSAESIALEPGPNVITVTARDVAGNLGADTTMVTYDPPQVSQPTDSGSELPGDSDNKVPSIAPAAPGCGLGAAPSLEAALLGLAGLRLTRGRPRRLPGIR